MQRNHETDQPKTALAQLTGEPPTVRLPDAGCLRIWTVAGDTPRNRAHIDQPGGHFVAAYSEADPPEQQAIYSAGQFGLSNNNRIAILWIEGVRASKTLASERILLEVDPDGRDGPASFFCIDAVRVTVANRLDLDVNNDGDLCDSVDLAKNYLPGYEGDQSRIEITTRQLFEETLIEKIAPQEMRMVLMGFGVNSGITEATFTIVETSKERGFCSNASALPLESANADDDFAFSKDANRREFTVTTSTQPNDGGMIETDRIWARIWCKDFGGRASVIVTAREEGSPVFTSEPVGIPVDNDQDLLADKWELLMVDRWNLQYGTQLPRDLTLFQGSGRDEELPDPDGPSNSDGGIDLQPHGTQIDPAGTKGDGLSEVEEYRGFLGTYPTEPYKHRRLDAARKELLLEVDVMRAQPGEITGANDVLTTAKSPTGIERENAGWQVPPSKPSGALAAMRVAPDKTQGSRFIISGNTADTLSVVGDVRITGDLATPSTFLISRYTPPDQQTMLDSLGEVATCFLTTAGVQVYYILDDDPEADNAWTVFWSSVDQFDWLETTHDVGDPVGQNDYSRFVHVGVVDIPGTYDHSLGGRAVRSENECIIFTFNLEAVAQEAGVNFGHQLASTITHEVGHVLNCSHHADEENVMALTFATGGAAAVWNASGWRARQQVTLSLSVGDHVLDLRAEALRTFQQLVAQVDGFPEYECMLTGDGTAQTSTLPKKWISIGQGETEQIAKYKDTDAIMFQWLLPAYGPIRFDQQLSTEIPSMNVRR